MTLFSITPTDRQWQALLALFERALEIEVGGFAQINAKLDRLGQLENQNTERILQAMATQTERLQEALNTLGTAIDDETAEVKAALEQIKADNPALEAAINDVIAKTEKVRQIVVNEPAIETVVT